LHKIPVPWILLRPEPFTIGEVRTFAVPKVEAATTTKSTEWVLVVLAWLPVTLPLLWGIWQTVKKAAVLFR
jgi:hypothetical protein